MKLHIGKKDPDTGRRMLRLEIERPRKGQRWFSAAQQESEKVRDTAARLIDSALAADRNEVLANS